MTRHSIVCSPCRRARSNRDAERGAMDVMMSGRERSEEHTSELQSRQYLVCRLLLENKKEKGAYRAALKTDQSRRSIHHLEAAVPDLRSRRNRRHVAEPDAERIDIVLGFNHAVVSTA